MTATGPTGKTRRLRFGALAGAAALAAVVAMTVLAEQSGAASAHACEAGTWLVPATGEAIPPDRLLASLAERPVVLLGESHDNAEDHRWQLHTLAALYGRRPDLALGFEAFPRRVQPVLDRWAKGELDAETFLDEVEWSKVWGFAPELYLPLFHFARQNRIPMFALNVERALIARVGQDGWAAVPTDERTGLSDPAPASEPYRETLARVYLQKQALSAPAAGDGGEETSEGTADAPHGHGDLSSVLQDEGFVRFVEAQLTWDRAFAEALASAARGPAKPLVVGIIGRGHLERGQGVPEQLAALGIPDAAVLLPVEGAEACEGLEPNLADAVFVVDAQSDVEAATAKPRLGVMIETAEEGVRILQVLEESVAAAAALAPGDIVVAAAGFPVKEVSDLIEIVQRQAPGTWLPLTIGRGGEELEVVARFPTTFGAP